MNTDSIKLSIMLEIMGRPPELLIESLNKHIDNLGKEEGVSIEKREIHEPKPIQGQKDLFTSFAEVELSVDSLNTLMMVLFNYSPAHIEVMSPSSFSLNLSELNTFLNESLRKLHQYDEIAKAFVIENRNMKKQLEELIKNPGELEKLKKKAVDKVEKQQEKKK